MQINPKQNTVTIPIDRLALIQKQLDRLQCVAQGIHQESKSDSVLTDFDIQMDALVSIRETLNLPKGPYKIVR